MKMLKGMALLLVLSSATLMVAVATPEDVNAWKKAMDGLITWSTYGVTTETVNKNPYMSMRAMELRGSDEEETAANYRKFKQRFDGINRIYGIVTKDDLGGDELALVLWDTASTIANRLNQD